jgi:hypothetical protein
LAIYGIKRNNHIVTLCCIANWYIYKYLIVVDTYQDEQCHVTMYTVTMTHYVTFRVEGYFYSFSSLITLNLGLVFYV